MDQIALKSNKQISLIQRVWILIPLYIFFYFFQSHIQVRAHTKTCKDIFLSLTTTHPCGYIGGPLEPIISAMMEKHDFIGTISLPRDTSKPSNPIDTEIEITPKLLLHNSSLANIPKPLKLSKYINILAL